MSNVSNCSNYGYICLLGLRINLEKSEFYPIGRVVDMEALATVLGSKVGSLPTTYLGLLLGARYNSMGAWMERSASERGWPYGRDNKSLREEEPHLLEACCQACRFIFYLFSLS